MAIRSIVDPVEARGKPLPKNQFLDSHQAAAFLGVSTDTVARWRMLKRGPNYSKYGFLIRYSIDDLLAYTTARKITLE